MTTNKLRKIYSELSEIALELETGGMSKEVLAFLKRLRNLQRFTENILSKRTHSVHTQLLANITQDAKQLGIDVVDLQKESAKFENTIEKAVKNYTKIIAMYVKELPRN